MIQSVSPDLCRAQVLHHVQPMRNAFVQLGSDLESGDLASARKDFEALGDKAKAMQSLGQQIQSGNLNGAREQYHAIQNAWQKLSEKPASTHNPLWSLASAAAYAAATYATGGGVLSASSILHTLV
jgi:hypothetical protein